MLNNKSKKYLIYLICIYYIFLNKLLNRCYFFIDEELEKCIIFLYYIFMMLLLLIIYCKIYRYIDIINTILLIFLFIVNKT
jgi:hypothetical protein